jgi:DNA end-binding protein Ku
MVQDPVQKRLRAMIRAKQKSLVKTAPASKRPTVKPTGNIVNMMDALKKSLAKETSRPKH